MEDTSKPLPYPKNFDWQGHRGARGLMPENTIPAFLKALEYPVKTLELDLVATADGKLVISHEPWMRHDICTKPNGEPVTEEEQMSLNIFQMKYSEVKKYDCGKRKNPKYPQQQTQKAHKPLLTELVPVIDQVCFKTYRNRPNYNIELKSHEKGYDIYVPQPEIFCDFLIRDLKELKIRKRVTIQSFDANVMNAIHKKDRYLTTAFLVENEEGVEANLKKLNFKPDIYSIDYQLLTKEMVDKLHKMDIKVIPWTVNDMEEMKKLIEWGVDGIITDYPNYINDL